MAIEEAELCESCGGPIMDPAKRGYDDDGNYYCGPCVEEFQRDHELCGLCHSVGSMHDDSTCPLCDGAGYVAKGDEDG